MPPNSSSASLQEAAETAEAPAEPASSKKPKKSPMKANGRLGGESGRCVSARTFCLVAECECKSAERLHVAT